MSAAQKTSRITCDHCGTTFDGTPSQIWHKKEGNRKTYCSIACRYAARRKHPKPNNEPCQHCGKVFFSKTSKKFCSMDCYKKSDQFLEMLRENTKRCREDPLIREKHAQAARNGAMIKCLECGNEFYARESLIGKKKYCSRPCYRSHMAKRFDRWIADPKQVALPQCYDEFLDQEELECIIDGCDWKGKHLSTHINLAHGLNASDFKRAAGFNLTSGIVSRPLSERMSERRLQGIALRGVNPEFQKIIESAPKGSNTSGYRSKEAKEHATKGRLLDSRKGPAKTCRGCGNEFTQSSVYGKTIYCSTKCRDLHYLEKDRRAATMMCSRCGKEFVGSIYQHRREKKSLPVYCSKRCSNSVNGAIKKK